MAKSNFQYSDGEEINPQTGTPSYYNLNKKKSPFSFDDFRIRNVSETPVVENVGTLFQPFGGVKGIDERLNAGDLYDIPEARANAQTGLELIGKALGQSVNEMILGTLESSGYLLDFPGLASSIAGNEGEFDNWFSKLFRDAKESIDEKYIPVYQTHAAQEGTLLDRTALAGGVKNIATSLSLMFPALGIARGINIAGKMVGMGAKTLQLTEAINAGLASRAAESTMEAQQYLKQYTDQNKTDLMKKYESKAMEEINNLPMVMPPNEYGFSPYSPEQRKVEEQRILDKYKAQIDAEANKMAVDGANKVFKANGALAVVDVLQYMPIFRGLGAIGEKSGSKTLEIGLQMGSEAGEEFFQSGSQSEAYGSIKAGVDMFGPGFSERFGEYLDSNEMKQSVFWGALGGGVFAAAAPLAKNAMDAYIDIDLWKNKASRTGNIEAFTKLSDDAKVDLISKHLRRNSLDKLSQDIDVLTGTLEDKDWAEIGMTKDEATQTVKSMQKDIAFIKAEKAKLDVDKRFNGKDEAKLDFLKTKLVAKNNAKLIGSIDKSITGLYNKITEGNELTPELLSMKKLQDQIEGFKNLKSNLSKIPSFKKNSELKTKVIKNTDLKIDVLQSKFNALNETYTANNPGDDLGILLKTSLDDNISDKYNKLLEIHTVQNEVVKKKLEAYEEIPHIEESDTKIKETRAKAQKDSAKESTEQASTVEDISDIAEAVPEEDIEDVDKIVSKKATEEAVDASDKPDLRYIGKPNLFIKEMDQIEGHVLAEYNAALDPTTDSELAALILSPNAEEFTKNLRMLSNLAKTSATHAKLYDSVMRFFENIGRNADETVEDSTVIDHSEKPVAEYSDDSLDDMISEFYATDSKSSDIGFVHPDEKVAQTPAQNRAVIREYTMTGGNIKRVNGVPEKDFVAKTMPIDWSYVNSPESLLLGSEIYFVINLDDTVSTKKTEYHKSLKGEDFINKSQILIAQRDKDGKEHIVNAIPIYNTNDGSEAGLKLKSLRDQVWQNMKASGQKTGMYNSGIKTKVTKKYAGRLLISKAKNAPHEVVSGQPLIFGIARSINGVVTINAGKNVSPEYSGIVVDGKNDGGVFILTRGANGRIIPARCFTQKLTSFPKLLSQAKALLLDSNKDNWAANREQLRKIVFFDYNYIAKTDSFEVYLKGGKVNTYTKEQIDALLKDKIVQIASSEINRGNYNESISKEGRLKTDLNRVKNIANANFEFSLDYNAAVEKTSVTVLPKEADDIVGDIMSTEPVVTVEPKIETIASEEPTVGDNIDDLEDFDNPLGTMFRLVDKAKVSNKELYQKWDELKETQWFNDRFPVNLIDVDTFRDGLINVSRNGGIQAWGMFKNAIAYISGAAQTGTVYHEAFHVVFHLYLTPKQQDRLLAEGAKKYKMDITKGIAIEERIADEFMEYVQTEESTTKTLGSKIKEFFHHLYQLIKSKLTNDVTINDVFYRAQHSMYKTSPFSRSVDNFKVTRYRDKNFKTPYEEERRTVALVDFMRMALDSYIANNPEYNNLTRRQVLSRMTAKGKTGVDYKGIDMLALSARAVILSNFKANSSVTDEQKKNVAIMLNKFIKMDSDGKVVFESLGRKALLQFARTEGLRIKINTKEISSSVDSAEGEPLMDFFEEESQNEGWQIKTEQLSGKESLSNEVRKELSYIPKVDSKGDNISDDLGFTIYQDFNTIYADIQRELANIVDSEEMIERLSEMVVTRPFLKPLLEKVQIDNLFKTKMFVNFNRSHVDYKIVIQSKDRETKNTEYRVMSANRMGVKNILIDEWKDNSTDPMFNKTIDKDGQYVSENLDKVKSAWFSLNSRLKAKDRYDSKDMSDLSRILNYIGITITVEDMEMLNKGVTSTSGYVKSGKSKVNEFKAHVDNIISKLTTGVNPFGATSLESEAIDAMSKTISKFRFELMESSFKNAENNTVYAHQVPTFLSRAIAQFSGKNAIDKIKYYQDTPFYRNSPWLKELMENDSRNNFEYIEIDAIKYDRTEKGVRYTSMSEKDFENTAINMYFNNGAKDYVYYKFPVVSDAPKMPFIKFRRYSTKETVDKLFEVYKQENARIEQIKARQAAREELTKQGLAIPDELKETKHYDTDKSRRFLFLSFLNSGNARKAVGSGNEVAIKKAISDWLDNEAKLDYDRLTKLEVFGKDAKGISHYDDRIDKRWGNTEAFHKDYFFNSFLANTQMMALFSGDPAFYKPDKSAQSIYSRTVDYQKRNKQNVSPKTTMDIHAVFELTQEQAEIEGKSVLEISPLYNSIYIKDLEIPSEHAETIFDTLVESGMPVDQAGDIAGAYGYNSSSKINVTDAQAYITLPRYRDIMIGLGRWDADLQEVYPRLFNGTASGKDLQLVMQPIKPFYFGHTKVGNLIIPTQNKNSEYLLLPQLVKQSKELTKLYDYMINNNISSANFNSAVKAGEFGAQSLENIEQTSIHELNNEDYGLQQETPEHHIDSRSLFGSQIRKLILSDISADAVFNINGHEFTKDQLVSLYQDIISEDLKQDYESVVDRFDNISSIHDLLLGEILDRDLGEEREIAIEIKKRLNRENGQLEEQFNLPLYHPYHAKSNESLLNSVFKNNVTKQKIKGGAFVQVSAFGFSDELNLIMDGKRLVGAEVKLPWWSKKYFEPLLDSNGQLDINKVPQNLREMIGYRIPTEDKYSMLPLIVTGFLPASAGGAVMLPMEITTISGSDFDIDKMYIMMPEWETSMDGKDIRKVEYEYNGDISSQSKQARNNAKIDIIRAILTHEDTFSKIIKPGGFPTLESLAKRVLGLEGKADEMLSIALPSTQTELFKRNMTGKQLIGIFANHNTNHAIMQFTNVSLANSVNLDGKPLASLHEIKNANGDYISRNVAEWLAAVVDNAKNPLSSFINVNTYTADIAALLTRLGYPLDTVVGFLSQPVLKEFSRLYFNLGADKQAESKVMSELSNKFSLSEAKVQTEAGKEFKFTSEELYAEIAKGDIISDNQLAVYNTFLMIKKQATALADLVRATRADTKGAGPTLSENEKLIQLRKDVLDNPELIGQEELLTGMVYPMENAFMEYGVSKPTELLSKYFPWFSPAFSHVKERITKSIKANTLTVKQIEQINYELLGFTATGFEFFDGSDKTEIINNMSKKVRAFKTKYPKKYEENFFVNKLVFKKDEKKSYLPERIQFKNTGSLTELDKQQIKEHWMSLMEDSDLAVDKEFSSFAKDLVKYAFYTAGFQLTPNSFSHLIPVDFYSNLVDSDGQSFNDYLIKTIEEAENENAFDEFIDQFFRNNSDDLSLVPAVDSDGFGNITGQITYINGVPSIFQVNAKDKKLRKDFIVGTTENGKKKLFSPFVSFREKGQIYLYQNMSRAWNQATYVLTSKLGIPNAALEYEKNEMFLDSVIQGNIPFKGKFTRASILDQANIKDVEADETEEVAKVKEPIVVSESSEIYNKLGSRTKSENVVIKTWGDLKGAKSAITNGNIVATRIPSSNEHFGNPFSHDPEGKAYGLIKTETVREAVEKFTDWVINSKDIRAQWIREQLKSGKLKGKPILYYKELGEPSHATALDYLINKYNWAETKPALEAYTGIEASLRSKLINELNNDDTLGEYLEVTVTDINNKNIEELGELYRKFCNR